jgi:hypothetical protein
MDRDELIKRYKEIYKKKTGKDLPDDEAMDQAEKLITLVGAIIGPSHNYKFKDL